MGYSVRSDSEDIFGKDNIVAWADLNNLKKSDEILSRINWAIQEAYDEINARLSGCRYTVPFALVSSAYDPIIVNLSARLVGMLLYDSRKLTDFEEYDELAHHRKKIEHTYKQIHAGQLTLITYEKQARSYPQAIPNAE